MPPSLIARKSGIHRAACLALFRALFRQINRLELIQPQKSALQTRVRNGIRVHLDEGSNPSILAALRRGYALLKVLREGVHKPLNSPALHIYYNLTTVPVPRTSSPHTRPLPLPIPLPSSLLSPPKKVSTYSRPGPMVWPHPNTPSIFDRPFPHVSGRRRVPYLALASGFPFLRIKKPQSQYLGRIIRDDVRLFQKRIVLTQRLSRYVELGLEEDRWDELLESFCGVKDKGGKGDGDKDGRGRSGDGVSWSYETNQANKEVSARITAHRQKRSDMAKRMLDIVKKEQALADKEMEERRNASHQKRKQRRLERRAAASNEPPASNEPVSNETL